MAGCLRRLDITGIDEGDRYALRSEIFARGLARHSRISRLSELSTSSVVAQAGLVAGPPIWASRYKGPTLQPIAVAVVVRIAAKDEDIRCEEAVMKAIVRKEERVMVEITMQSDGSKTASAEPLSHTGHMRRAAHRYHTTHVAAAHSAAHVATAAADEHKPIMSRAKSVLKIGSASCCL